MDIRFPNSNNIMAAIIGIWIGFSIFSRDCVKEDKIREMMYAYITVVILVTQIPMIYYMVTGINAVHGNVKLFIYLFISGTIFPIIYGVVYGII